MENLKRTGNEEKKELVELNGSLPICSYGIIDEIIARLQEANPFDIPIYIPLP